MRKALHFANLPRQLCQLLLGEDHHIAYRFASGLMIMTAGVACAKFGGDLLHFLPYSTAHILANLVGHSAHGLGAVPFIDWLLAHADEPPADAQDTEVLWPSLTEGDRE